MELEEVIGTKLARLRDARGMSQAQVGEALPEYLGKPWSRQAVSAAEKGRRAFTAAELVSLALSLRVSLVELLIPLDGADELELPGGAKVGREAYERSIVVVDESERSSDLLDRLGRLHQWVYKLAVMVATGAPPYDAISSLVNEGLLTTDETMTLLQLRTAFAKTVPAAGNAAESKGKGE